MAVIRVEKTKDYTTMSNYHFREKDMSLKAKGLLSMILSLPEDWDYTLEGLSLLCKDGVDSVRTALRELKEFGYVETARVRDEKGHLRDAEYVVYEKPVTASEAEQSPVAAEHEEKEEEKPVLEEPVLEEPVLEEPTLEKPILENPTLDNPTLEKPILENPRQLNTNISSTNILNTNISNQPDETDRTEKPKGRRAYYPESEELDKAFKAFVYMRKRINRPLTNTGIVEIKYRLEHLSTRDGTFDTTLAVAILKQSIMNSWPGVYELKKTNKPLETKSDYGNMDDLEKLITANT